MISFQRTEIEALGSGETRVMESNCFTTPMSPIFLGEGNPGISLRQPNPLSQACWTLPRSRPRSILSLTKRPECGIEMSSIGWSWTSVQGEKAQDVQGVFVRACRSSPPGFRAFWMSITMRWGGTWSVTAERRFGNVDLGLVAQVRWHIRRRVATCCAQPFALCP